MFVREKKVYKGDKSWSYYQVVQNQRSNGQVVQRLIRYLGKYPDKDAAIQAAIQLGYPVGQAKTKAITKTIKLVHPEPEPEREPEPIKLVEAPAKERKPKKVRTAAYISRLQALEERARATTERGHSTKKFKTAQAEYQEAKEHASKLYDEVGPEHEDYKKADRIRTRKEKKLDRIRGEVLERRMALRRKALEIHDALTPAQQEEARQAVEFVDDAVRQRERSARVWESIAEVADML